MDSQVLVGIINREKDLKTLFSEKWYRVPVHKAPKRKFELIAFYQTSAFGKAGRRIRYYGHVISKRTAKRANLLPDEPQHPHSNNEYYQFFFDRIKKKKKEIFNTSHRRVTFFFSTSQKLHKSRTIDELLSIRSSEEDMACKLAELKIPVFREYRVMDGEKCKYRLDFAIFCTRGKVDVECDSEKWHSSPRRRLFDMERDRWLSAHNWTVVRFTSNEICRNAEDCVGKLTSIIEEKGGLSPQKESDIPGAPKVGMVRATKLYNSKSKISLS